MVRGLVIRQAFILLDIALAGAVLVTAGYVAQKLVRPVGAKILDDLTESAGPREIQLATVGALSDYNTILESGLFGAAGKWDHKAPPPPPPPAPAALEDTTLNLKLTGTLAAADPRYAFNTAFVSDLDKRVLSKGFWIGEEVVDRVQLIEVYPGEVVLLNKRLDPPKKERLRLRDGQESQLPGRRLAALSPVRSARTERIQLNKQEIAKELYSSFADISNTIKPVLFRDKAGKVLGVTASNISKVPLAKKLGLQDGDVLTSVNNEKIDSQEKILRLVQKYQYASTIRISLLRDGKTKVLMYNLK